MEDQNWELLQFKHEILGYSIEELAAEHGISLPVLKFNASTWKQLPLAKEKIDLHDLTSFEEILTKLGEQTEVQTKAFQTLKQKFLGPKYIELETVLLHKAISLATSIKETDPYASRTLTSLSNVLSSLLQQNPLLKGESDEDGSGGSREWKITIVDPDTKEE